MYKVFMINVITHNGEKHKKIFDKQKKTRYDKLM